ncbi:MAG: cupin domain-containing protein [Phycisphaerae bacterium]|nr:cupin domain-containing protein [Phycisphaerae bacterium]
MNEAIDSMQLQGPKRRESLDNFARQIAQWGLAMPPVEPLVIDFGMGDFDRVGLIEYWIANELEAGYCGKYLFLFDGQQCPFHGHKQKYETFFVVKGEVKMVVGGKEQIMNQGAVLAMPPGDVHSFTGIGNALILEISTPCLVSDNEFKDPKIAEWLKNNLK